LANAYAMTAKRSSDGKLDDAGSYDSVGADVDSWMPGIAHGAVGVSFSR